MASESTQKTTSSTAPANPMVNQTVNKLLGGVQDAYAAGPKVFGQSLYAGQSDATKGGLASLLSSSQGPNYFGAANNYAGGLINSGGLTSGQKSNLGSINSIGQQYQGIASNANGPSMTEKNLSGAASGSNPLISGVASQYQNLANNATRPGLAESALMGTAQNGSSGVSGIGSQYRGIASNANNPSLTESTMMDVAQGKYLNNTDPDFQAMVDRTANQTAADINASIGADGRYGSSLHTQALGDTIGALRTNAAVQNRQNELARQQQALSSIENARQTGINNQFSGLAGALGAEGQNFNQQAQSVSAIENARQAGIGNQFAGLAGALGAQGQGFGQQSQALSAIENARQTGINNQFGGLAGALGAAGQGFTMGQQGIANAMDASGSLGSLYQQLQLPGQTQLAVGAAQDADAQAQRQGAYDLFSRQNNAQTDLLAKLSSILAGNAQVSGTTTTNTSPSTPWWQSALGVGIGLL